jgi:hypothetical protein
MLRWYLPSAVVMLFVAAATGVLLRFGMVYGLPVWAANFAAVRHAHSHLMYFGWVTLGLMALIWHHLPTLTGRRLPRAAHVQMAATALLAALSFPAFWVNGYGLTEVGGRALPLGSMAAGLNGLGWAAFVLLYVRATWRLAQRPLPVRLWDWAVILMLMATAGAFGVALLVVLGVQSPLLQQLFLHLFLDLFGIGWFGLALLGLLWAAVLPQGGWRVDLPVGTLALALLPTFILGMTPQVVTPAMFWTAAVANLVAGWGWWQHLAAFWPHRRRLPRLVWAAGPALALHLLMALLLLWPGLWRWSAGTQLRVFFLHNWLLAIISTGLLGLMFWEGSATMRRWLAPALPYLSIGWVVGVGVMVAALGVIGLAALLPNTVLFSLKLAAWASLLPMVVALGAALALPVAQRLR